jgi:histone H1/5
MKAALKRGVETGVLVQVKASYKLSPEAKKPAPKKKAAPKKATAVKKAAPKKKVRCCRVGSLYSSF